MANVNGLEGIIAAETEISLVDGANGHLVYRGFDIQSLAETRTFEEIAYLLWYGHLPGDSELTGLREALCRNRYLPQHVIKILDLLPPDTDMMDVLRTAISAIGSTSVWPPTIQEAIRFTALVPTIVAFWFARIRNVPFTPSKNTLSHVENYLYMIRDGVRPPAEQVRALETYLIAGMEHGMNASTFSARVVTSTQSDMASALVAAVGAMKGPLHGGAPSKVMNMLDDIGDPELAEPWLRRELEAGHKLMGFGHRVYKTHDPRANALCAVVKSMDIRDSWLELALYVEKTAVNLLAAYKPGRNLFTNVEFWAAAVFRALSLQKSLYTPTFTMARVVGWTTHILEQGANNRLIRPSSKYTGASI
jgi:citrate synthase